MATEITIRGITYPSIAAAGRSIGVASTTILSAIADGREQTVGMGHNYSRKVKVELNGVIYGSSTRLARSLGVDTNKLTSAIAYARRLKKTELQTEYGLIKIIGNAFETDPDFVKTIEGAVVSGRAPIRIRGITYENRKHAAKSLGVTLDVISSAVRNGKTDKIGLRKRNVELKFKGVNYPSISKFAEAMGICKVQANSRISHARRKGTDWAYFKFGTVEIVGNKAEQYEQKWGAIK